MSSRTTAKEARTLMEETDMVDLLLGRVYRSIERNASNGQSQAMRYVEGFEMSDVQTVISELRDDGYSVSIQRDGLSCKRVREFTKIVVEW